jgi:UDP-N-acetylmuramyl pentapeptide synthase
VRGDAAALAEGALSGGGRGEVVFAADAAEAESVVKARLEPGDAVFVKGSRGVGLDRLADTLAPRSEGRP